MNKHDFYKQLMSEYSFDADKIKENARKGKFARQKISPIAIGLTAAVAACTVACGTIAITMMESRNGVDLIDTSGQTLSALSASERVQNAIEQQTKAKDSEEIQSVLVTFSAPQTADEVERILSAHTDSNIPVKAVFLSDGSRVTGSSEVASVFESDNTVSAICIECAGSVMSLLQSDPDIFLVELMSESDFDTAIPISPDVIETTEVIIPDIDIPVPDIQDEPVITPGGEDIIPIIPILPETEETVTVTETTDTVETSEIEETVDFGNTDETTGSTEILPETEETDVPETPVTPVLPEAPVTEEAPPAVTDPQTTEAPETEIVPEQPEQPVAPPVQQPPADVTLTPDIKDIVYQSENVSAISAYFLENNIFFTRTAEGIALYEYYGGKETLIDSVPCLESRVHWVSETGTKLLVSGLSSEGNRNKMWLVDSQSRNIFDIHAEDAIMYGNLSSAGYDSNNRRLFLNTKIDGIYYLYALSLDGSKLSYIETPFWSSAKITMLGSSSNNIYLSVNDASLTQIYRVNILTRESNIIKTYDNNPKIVSNLAFTHAVISPAESALTGTIEIFDPETESFISTGHFNESVTFGASRHSLSIGGSFFTISGGAIAPATESMDLLDAIDYKRSFSKLYTASVNDGCIKITQSSYSDTNRETALVFGSVTSNADAQLKNVLSGAIGLNNALSLDTCYKAGIKTQEKLMECLRAYYSADCVNALTAQCEINPAYNVLDYTAGRLSPLSFNKTELVITASDNTTASGTLYVKVGTFCGKPAYRTINVSFVKENGVWKLGNILK